MNAPRTALYSLLLLIATAPLMAQGTYTQIDYPGATATLCSGINSAGDISGTYYDASNNSHGFLVRNGVYVSVDYPGLANTVLGGLNDFGDVVGYAANTGQPVSFVYDMGTAVFTPINYPGAYNTYAIAINNSGTVAGFTNLTIGSISVGFVLNPRTGRSELIEPPRITQAFGRGVTSSNEVVGFYFNGGAVPLSYVFKSGNYRPLTLQNLVPPAYISALGVNPSGTEYVGEYNDTPSTFHPFTYQNKTFSVLDVPGTTTGGAAMGVNDAGDVVGCFTSDRLHGFLWTPPATPQR